MQLRINVDFQLRSLDAALDDWRRSQRFVEVARHRQSQGVGGESSRATRQSTSIKLNVYLFTFAC